MASLPMSLAARSVASRAITARSPHSAPCLTSSAASVRASARSAARSVRLSVVRARASQRAIACSGDACAGAGVATGAVVPTSRASHPGRARANVAAGAAYNGASSRSTTAAASVRARSKAAMSCGMRGATCRSSNATVIARTLMPRSSMRSPSGTDTFAVTRTSSSCSARRSGRNATRSGNGSPVRSASSCASASELRTCSGRNSVASGSRVAGISDAMPGFQGPWSMASVAGGVMGAAMPVADRKDTTLHSSG